MNTTAQEVNIHFENAFRLHYGRLCSYAYSFVKDEGTSEDIVQEVFIKIWNQRQDLIGSGQLKFYLFTAVRNNCLTVIQKNKKNVLVEIGDEYAMEDVKIRVDAADMDTDPQLLISKAMDQLPPKCREVFMLSRLSGQTYQQIADSLGISVKTVENQMGKAIRILKVFAKEHKIYFLVLYCMISEKETIQAIGVFIGKCFYK